MLVLLRTALTFRENATLLERSVSESLTDSLTGIANRRKLVADLEPLLAAASPEDAHLLVIFDLNGFKDYNDTFGHPAGDALLARLAAKLEEATAPVGRAYRLGGDEFCAHSRVGGAPRPRRLRAAGRRRELRRVERVRSGHPAGRGS